MALSTVEGILCARAQSKPIYPQKIKATAISIIVKFILKTKTSTSSITKTISKAKKSPLPILKKKLGNVTDKAIIKTVRIQVAPKAYEIVIIG